MGYVPGSFTRVQSQDKARQDRDLFRRANMEEPAALNLGAFPKGTLSCSLQQDFARLKGTAEYRGFLRHVIREWCPPLRLLRHSSHSSLSGDWVPNLSRQIAHEFMEDIQAERIRMMDNLNFLKAYADLDYLVWPCGHREVWKDEYERRTLLRAVECRTDALLRPSQETNRNDDNLLTAA